MTKTAKQFITPMTLQALSGNPVLENMWDPSEGNGMEHINLSRTADLILIAPASANFLAKLSNGIADDLECKKKPDVLNIRITYLYI